MGDKHIPIRFSHLIGYSGPGAVVRGPYSLMVVQDTSKWTDKDGKSGAEKILYVERVRQALDIQEELRSPPNAKEVSDGHVEGVCVPATRFPRWMRCPKCGRLYPQSEWKKQSVEEPVCTNPKCSKPRLEQVQYVMVHPEGFLADVSWHFLAHRDELKSGNQCKKRDRLVLDFEKQELRCDACGANAKFNVKEPQSFGNNNMQPWLWDMPVPVAFQGDSKAYIRKVNDALVYSPVTVSALVIPPESRVRKGTIVDLLYRNSSDRAKIDSISEEVARAKTALQKKKAEGILDELAKKYRCTVSDIKTAADEIQNGYPDYGRNFSDTKQIEEEYKAFLEEFSPSDDEDFVTHPVSKQWSDFVAGSSFSQAVRNRANMIQDLIRVDRLKEVRVFKGFRREFGDKIVPPDIVGEATWLPAIELYGEGVFFTLREELLSKWEKNEHLLKRFQPQEKRFLDSGREEPKKLTPRFILLHTLSHLLIRQLEAVGGYPAASLTERIYCSFGIDVQMSGILIYTAAPDKTGTLGGLAELSEPIKFMNILSHAIDHATWCSSDPVCSEHEGQGPGSLNLSACHACALIPDTACAYGNVLLDRVLIKGDREKGIPSLFEGGDV